MASARAVRAVAVDFFVVPTLTFRLIFRFIILRHDRRELIHVNVTNHPTAAWTARQFVEAFPDDTAPHYLLPDRDEVFHAAHPSSHAYFTCRGGVADPGLSLGPELDVLQEELAEILAEALIAAY